jgi:hypothetical protein
MSRASCSRVPALPVAHEREHATTVVRSMRRTAGAWSRRNQTRHRTGMTGGSSRGPFLGGVSTPFPDRASRRPPGSSSRPPSAATPSWAYRRGHRVPRLPADRRQEDAARDDHPHHHCRQHLQRSAARTRPAGQKARRPLSGEVPCQRGAASYPVYGHVHHSHVYGALVALSLNGRGAERHSWVERMAHCPLAPPLVRLLVGLTPANCPQGCWREHTSGLVWYAATNRAAAAAVDSDERPSSGWTRAHCLTRRRAAPRRSSQAARSTWRSNGRLWSSGNPLGSTPPTRSSRRRPGQRQRVARSSRRCSWCDRRSHPRHGWSVRRSRRMCAGGSPWSPTFA